MTEPTVSDVLRRAAEIHAERGGCKGSTDDAEGHICMMGAVFEALHQTDESYGSQMFTAVREAVHLAAHAVDPRLDYGSEWNDLPETTDEDVQKFLLRVADEVEFQS
jgi:hypothetical protein